MKATIIFRFLILSSLFGIAASCSTFKADIFEKTVVFKYGYIGPLETGETYAMLTSFPLDDNDFIADLRKRTEQGEVIRGDIIMITPIVDYEEAKLIIIVLTPDAELSVNDLNEITYQISEGDGLYLSLPSPEEITIIQDHGEYFFDLGNLSFDNDGLKEKFSGNACFRGKLTILEKK